MNPILHKVRVVSASLLSLAIVFTPTLSSAASSRTYTFTEKTSSQYTTTGTTTWYSPEWKYRQKITISKDSIGEDLTDFPVVVRLGDTDIYNHAKEDGTDILFTTSDGVTKLSHELEGNTTAWVKVPKLTPLNDTELYLYYGNPTAEDQQNVSDVWTNGYVGVWHMNGNPTDGVKDSTKQSNDGVQSGSMNKEDSLQEGKLNKGFHFDGTNDHIVINDDESLNPSTFTLESWVRPDTATPGDRWRPIISKHYGGVPYLGGYTFQIPSGTRKIRYWTSGGNHEIVSTTDLPLIKWTHVVGTFRANDGKKELFINGRGEGSASGVGAVTHVPNSLQIGYSPGAIAPWDDHYDGRIDEVRISNVARSTAWIVADYKNQVGTEDFLTISDTVETTPHTTADSTTSTITLKPTQALSFTNLLSFKSNTQPTTTFQLSNDAGKTWLFYTKDGWKSANPSNPLHRSSINDIASHLNTFPQGGGKLTFKAYLQPGSTLDSISISYTPSTSTKNTATFPQTIIALNSLYRQAYNQDPSFLQWTYWAKRMLVEKKTQSEWLDAMKWARVNGR